LPHSVGLYADFTTGSDYRRSRVAASAYCRRATDAVGAGVRNQRSGHAVAAEGGGQQRSLYGGTTRSSGPRPLHEVVIAVAKSGQFVAEAPVVSRDVDEGRPILYWPWWCWPASIFVSSGTGTSTSTRRKRIAMGLLSGDGLRNVLPFENGKLRTVFDWVTLHEHSGA
jgi:hypothetical protein